ncbi:NAD(P)-dependent dehydrogenase (short-subunit alcohol dehydrogenase family) [Gracilibacillus alcaliphilus]|nr:NAD(P)-dependent dehydrogenase (short-subunit alcohol dehydrogenase family) [Gracilibacillus alcaliphilus]
MPGIIDTDSTAHWLHTPEGQKNAQEMSALQREGKPEEVAGAVSYLVNSKADFVTGHHLDVTGGAKL